MTAPTPRLNDCYLALGFKSTPFSILPDTSMFFLNGPHVSAYDNLRFAMQGGLVAVLTGEVGLGKTLVSRLLLRNLPNNVHAALLINPLLSYSEILSAIYKDLTGKTAFNQGSLGLTHDLLLAFALQCASRGEYLVVLVDEAHKLSAEALEGLRLLSNLETEQRKLISLVLIGQPELEKTLSFRAMRPLRQRVGVWCRLRAMTRSESVLYVQHRMSLARNTGNTHFSTWAMYLIYHYTKGVPRRINLLCERALLLAFATGQERIGWSMVRRAAAEMGPRRPV